jgi:alkylation response protein AidB-like acyl-CoA dehydrogenase
METIGSALMVEPFLQTVALGARLVAREGSPALRGRLLPPVAEGRLQLAFAHDEASARYDAARIESRAEPVSGGWRITGRKSLVIGAPSADHLIVSARTGGVPGERAGISLFLVEPGRAGLTMRTLRTQDNQRAADLSLDAVFVDREALIGHEGSALDSVEEAIDFATALACAEAVGAMKYANAATLEYLKTRRQFGVPIGSFQALQHRLVDMFISAEQSRSIMLLACSRVDAAARGEISADERMRSVSAAKLRICDAVRHVGQEAIQLHGGMGMTQEMKVAHTFKRLTMLGQQFGDADHHLDRYSALT